MLLGHPGLSNTTVTWMVPRAGDAPRLVEKVAMVEAGTCIQAAGRWWLPRATDCQHRDGVQVFPMSRHPVCRAQFFTCLGGHENVVIVGRGSTGGRWHGEDIRMYGRPDGVRAWTNGHPRREE